MDQHDPSSTEDRTDDDAQGGVDTLPPVSEGHEYQDAPAQPEPEAGRSLTDEEMATAYTDQAGQLKDLGEGDEHEQRAGMAAVEAAREGRKLTDGEATSALDWFLNEDPSAAAEETELKELNFGTQDNPKWVPWTIKAVPMETMRSIRKKAQGTRLARTTGETDEYRVNLEIVVEGTVDPPIKEATATLNREGRFSGDPVDALRAKFQPKPGYIAQLAGAIMTLSGFNDEDVRDAERAAKN